jgi:hypothetical protein
MISNYDMATIFKNVESLFAVNTRLLELLQEEAKKEQHLQRIGSVFLEMV